MNAVEVAVRYAQDVISGEIVACTYVRQACARFIRMLEDTLSDDSDIVFDGYAANRVCRTIQKYPHVKGKWAAKNESFALSPWQVFCTVAIFGFKRKDNGNRIVRDAYIEVPRKNGKTFWVASIGLYMLTEDGEFGAEVYCGATSEKQAYEVFGPVKKICQREADLREHYGLEVNAKTIVIQRNGSKFEPLIGDPGDGASPSCGIADEFHEHANDNLVDTLVTGMGARENPLMLYITTAGADMGGPCYAKRDDVKNILSGAVKDDTVFGIIYTLDDDDEWDTVAAQQKANPNYGVSVFPEYLEARLQEARRSARKQVAYKTKHLNQWVGAKAAWMNMLALQRCRSAKVTREQYLGKRCYSAFDLATRTDLAVRADLFPAQDGLPCAAFFVYYLPEDVINDGGNQKYAGWAKEGWIVPTPGNVIDFAYIEDDFREFASSHDVLEAGYDPFQATQFSTNMVNEMLPMIEVRQTVANFSEPMKEVEKMVLAREIVFTMDPVIFWMFGNVVAKLDAKENIYPNKERNENKIDGVVALIMTVNRLLNAAPPAEPSVYESQAL